MANAYILVVDDEPDIRSLLKEILEDEGYEVAAAESAEEARLQRRSRRPDLVLLDIWLPDVDGITLLKEWKEEGPLTTPVIMMSGHGTVETAVEATRLGAYDFIEKPLSLAKLLVTVQRALQAFNLFRENVGLLSRIRPVSEPVGRSAVTQRLREQVRRIAQHETAVLITGEPGSGKSLFARYLHAHSPRRDGPFVEVGIASLVGENPAAVLFGEEKNDKVRYGLLEQANGGTLLLNDIADMDINLQARLLGALESGSYHRAGGSESVTLDLRVIAATRHDLGERVAQGLFRNDLFYFLSVVPLAVPPLREHGEDVPELLNYYTDYFVAQDRLPFRTFTTAAQNRLRQYSWPGNVRELKNLVQRLLILGSTSEVESREIESVLGGRTGGQAVEASAAFELPLRQAREAFERAYFEELLRLYEGSVNRVAQHAGIERTHLYRKLRSLGLGAKQGGSG